MRASAPKVFCCGRPKTMNSCRRLLDYVMTTRAIAGICLCLALISPGQAQDRYPAQCAGAKEMIVMNHAIGTFDVKVTTQVAGEGDEATIGRMTLDKQFH